jgi:hypothetical protein
MDTRIGPLLRSITRIFPSSHYAILSLFLFIGLELLFVIHRWLFLLLFLLLGILVIGVFLIRSEEGAQFHSTQTILPTLAAFGFAGLAVYLPVTALLHVYFIACAIVFFTILKYGAKQAWPTWNMVISLTVLFAALVPTIGWRFLFYAPVWGMLALIFVIVTLLSFQSFLRYVQSTSEAGLIALALGFTLTEIAWILQFLPLHFIVQAGFLVATYYTTSQLATIAIEKNIERKTIIEYGLVGGGAIILLVLTANWS